MYKYEEQKSELFTEHGSVMFTQIRDVVKSKLRTSGAVKMESIIAQVSGSTWDMLACVDRMVELGEIREVTHADKVRGQDRVFVNMSLSL